MGRIHDEVYTHHLSRFSEEEQMIKPFLRGFDITWARRRTAYNTTLSVYFLLPEQHMTETFGFFQEILLVASTYPTLEPRTIQAAEQFLNDDPGRGRLERIAYFVVSSMERPVEWVRSYVATNQESRLIVAFATHALSSSTSDDWYIRNRIMEQLFSRDLFDFRLPLAEDTYFFGRDNFLMDYLDAARRGENRGVFGLRKTGKTSFLFKLQRSLTDQDNHVIYLDCKSPSVRQLSWSDLLTDICKNISLRLNLRFVRPSNEKLLASRFTELLASVPQGKRVALIFDEIEYVSPYSQDDEHWHHDYIPFWQTIWAAQSVHRNLFVVLAGVNPNIVEIDRINRTQNPLFGIVSYKYLTGLGEDEIRRMLRVLGRRMGIRFSESAIKYVHIRYGGHPLLTRLACSYIHQSYYHSGTPRPIDVAGDELRDGEIPRDAELTFYCRHVVSELQDFYPDEYDMLEYLASGKTQDFLELSVYPEYIRHLRAYGLIDERERSPKIAIPVVGRYVALEDARRNGRRTILDVVPFDERPRWLKHRTKRLLTDIQELEKLIDRASLPLIYGPNSIPHSHKLVVLTTVENEGEFENFINVCNQCLVEGIETYGAYQHQPKYFWTTIRSTYPGLFPALHRIKVYRHKQFHMGLSSSVDKDLNTFLHQDLEGRRPDEVADLWFVLQQCVLDSLLSGLQIEIGNLSS